MDGNKRTALLAVVALLSEHDIDLDVEEAEMYSFFVAMSEGKKQFSQIVEWLGQKTK